MSLKLYCWRQEPQDFCEGWFQEDGLDRSIISEVKKFFFRGIWFKPGFSVQVSKEGKGEVKNCL